eukprot:6204279-Pleurochrysis_carterae.AAC.1
MQEQCIELDVIEANGGEAADLKQVDKVAAAAALVGAKKSADFVNVRMRAGLHLTGHLVRDRGRASRDQSVVDRHNLVDIIPRPKPLAHVDCSEADAAGAQYKNPNSFSRISHSAVCTCRAR